MTTPTSVDWAALLDPVARHLLGEPNPRISRPRQGELRYGRRGSLVVHVPPHNRAGGWKDFETSSKGGVLDLVERELGVDRRGAIVWMKNHGYLSGGDRRVARTPDSQSSARQKAPADEERRRARGRRVWAALQQMPTSADSPAGRWREARHLWRPEHPWPSPLRWIDSGTLRGATQWRIPDDVAGAVVALMAPLAAWAEAWPTLPQPTTMVSHAIRDDGTKGAHWPDGPDKARMNLVADAARSCPVLVVGNPSGSRVLVCEGLADALALASRIDSPVIAPIGVSPMRTAEQTGLAQTLAQIFDLTVVYADRDDVGRPSAPAGVRGGRMLARAVQAAGGQADTRHAPGEVKDAAEWAGVTAFPKLIDDTFASYGSTLVELHPDWPR